MAVRPIDLAFMNDLNKARGGMSFSPRATYGGMPEISTNPVRIPINATRENVLPKAQILEPNVQQQNNNAFSGLLGSSFADPKTYGLLGASAKMLEQGGYSTTPRTFGQIVGSGLNAGLANYAQANKLFNRPKLQVVGGALIDTSDPNNPKVVYESKPKTSNTKFVTETGQVVDYSDPTNPVVTNVEGYKIPPKTPKIGEAKKAIDREFGKVYSKFVLDGGASVIGKNITQLQDASKILETHLREGKDLTGVYNSALPDSLRSFFNPEGVKVQQMVEEVVQSNLKAVLGGQFSEREAEQLLARSFNPRLLPEENIRRINNLQKSIELAFQQKLKAIEYFEANGTMDGFKGASSITLDQIKKSFETFNKPNKKLKIKVKP